jgi:hypothetical protein
MPNAQKNRAPRMHPTQHTTPAPMNEWHQRSPGKPTASKGIRRLGERFQKTSTIGFPQTPVADRPGICLGRETLLSTSAAFLAIPAELQLRCQRHHQ